MTEPKKEIRAVIVITPEDCQAHTCDCEPGSCAFEDDEDRSDEYRDRIEKNDRA